MDTNNDSLERSFIALVDSISSRVTPLKDFELNDLLSSLREELNFPLRVALSGSISAGKTTLLNSILGKAYAPTDTVTNTTTVNSFRHIKYSPDGCECVVVHRKDGSIGKLPISFYSSLVSANEDDKREALRDIELVEIFIDNENLLKIDFIDTPGLDSPYEFDSDNTSTFLSDIRNRPDVLIFLSSQVFQERDISAVMEYQKRFRNTSGLNTIAVLSKADTLLGNASKVGEEYISIANKALAGNYKDYSSFRRCFSASFAIAAVYAEATCKMTKEDFLLLMRLSKYSDNVVLSTRNVNEFLSEERSWHSDVSVDILTDLWQLYGKYPLLFCLKYLKRNPDASFEQMLSALYDYSNVKNFRSEITSLFLGRSILFYKIDSLLSKLKGVLLNLSKQVDGERRKVIQSCKYLIDSYEMELIDCHKSLFALKDYYQGLCDEFTCFIDEDWDDIIDLLQGRTLCDDKRNKLQLLCSLDTNPQLDLFPQLKVVTDAVIESLNNI